MQEGVETEQGKEEAEGGREEPLEVVEEGVKVEQGDGEWTAVAEWDEEEEAPLSLDLDSWEEGLSDCQLSYMI